MKTITLQIKSLLFFALFCTIFPSYSDIIHEIKNTEDTKLIKLNTNQGEITIKLFEAEAPETVKNFLQYAKSEAFNGTIFHRVIANFMIQGGGLMPDMTQIPSNAPVVNESNNNLSNKKGTLAMARTSDPHSATSQFFINLKDNDFLDKANAPDQYGYCVFGEVIEGIEVVEKIGQVQTGNASGHSDVPLEAILIESVIIIEK